MIPYLPLFTAQPDADPNGILIEATADNPGEITATIDAIAARDPDDAVVWEAGLVDVTGLPIQSLDLTDLLRVTVTARDTSPAPDVTVWAGLSAGPVGSSRGMAVGLWDAVTGWKVTHAASTAAVWAPTGALATWPRTRAAGLQAAFGTTTVQGRITAYGLEADPFDPTHLRPSLRPNTSTVTSSNNVGGGFDRVFLAIGRLSGTGEPVTVTVGMSAMLLRLTDHDGLDPIQVHDPGPLPPVTSPSVVLTLGQSNAMGTVAGPDSGDPLPSGMSYVHNGVAATTWPAGNTPSCSILPTLGRELLVDSPEVLMFRRAVNSGNIDNLISVQLTGSRTDTRAWGTKADLIVIIHGEADSRTQAAALAYEEKLEQLVQGLESDNPWAVVEIVELRSTTYGAWWSTIRAAQAAVAARRSNRRYVSTTQPTMIPLFDAVHYSSATGSGFDQLALRCLDAY